MRFFYTSKILEKFEIENFHFTRNKTVEKSKCLITTQKKIFFQLIILYTKLKHQPHEFLKTNLENKTISRTRTPAKNNRSNKSEKLTSKIAPKTYTPPSDTLALPRDNSLFYIHGHRILLGFSRWELRITRGMIGPPPRSASGSRAACRSPCRSCAMTHYFIECFTYRTRCPRHVRGLVLVWGGVRASLFIHGRFWMVSCASFRAPDGCWWKFAFGGVRMMCSYWFGCEGEGL